MGSASDENQGVNRRPARRAPNLDSIFAEIDAKPKVRGETPLIPVVKPEETTPVPSETEQAVPAVELVPVEEKTITLPDGLEKYLTPPMWHNLVENPERHGVLVNALDRLRSLLYLISTFIPAHLVQEKMNRAVAGLVSGQILRGSMLFSDVSGFTALSEKLAAYGPEGAERLTAAMNRYFTTMLEILSWSGGTLVKFAGDAMLVYFPEQSNGAHAASAVRAALRMMRAIQEFANMETPAGVVSLKMKVGVASGSLLAVSIGSEQRMEYGVLGDAVAQTMKCESQASAGEVVANQATVDLLGEDFSRSEVSRGFYKVNAVREDELGDYEISPQKRRARGAMPWSASPQAIMVQMDIALRQLRSLQPYLATELIDRLITHAQQRTVESEYRPTTVLFMNFTGAEELLAIWGEDGASRLTTLLSGYFNAMQEAISRFGGIVSRIDPYSKGTKMLVLFGAPVTHEDDPQRCVSAALAMNAELETLNERWRKRFARHLPQDFQGALIQHRIGITHGITYAGQVGSSSRREYTVMGDDVNLAARLMGAADMGQILISQRVQEAVEDYFVTTALHPIKVKGKTKPIPIFQVDGPRDDTLLNRVRNRDPLVGRESELASARQVLQRALAGDSSVLTLEGAAGIGKSHLVDSLLKPYLLDDKIILSHFCRAYAVDVPYSAWNLLLRHLMGITALDSAQISTEKFNRFLTDLEIPEEDFPLLARLMSIQQLEETEAVRIGEEPKVEDGEGKSLTMMLRQKAHQKRGSDLNVLHQLSEQQYTVGRFWKATEMDLREAQQDKLAAVVIHLFNHAAARKPIILVIEDAHWLDGYSRHLLTHIAQETRDLPFAVVLVQRNEVAAADQVGEIVKLEPLILADTKALVAHILVSDLADVIQEQSQGSPMVVEEISLWVKHSLKIDAEELKKILQTSDLLQKIILSDLEGLPELPRDIIRSAAVAGNEFRFGEVQALLPDLVDPSSMVNHIRSLVKAGLIELLEAGIDARYAFKKAAVREILYNNLPFERRRELHGRLANYLATSASRRKETQSRLAALMGSSTEADPAQEAERIGYHYEQAGEWLKAASQYLSAAVHSRDKRQFSRTNSSYQHALVCLENVPAEDQSSESRVWKVTALFGQGDMAFTAGDYPGALVIYEKACAEIQEGIEPAIELELHARRSLALAALDRAPEGRKLLEGILGKYPTERNSIAAGVMAWLAWRGGDENKQKWIEGALELTGEGISPLRALLTEMKGDIGGAMQGYQQAEDYAGAALLQVRLGDRFYSLGDPGSARMNYEKAADFFARRQPNLAGQALALFRKAEIAWEQEGAEAAQTLLKQALELVNTCVSSIRKEAREDILTAIQRVNSGKSQPFPTWKWTHFEDEVRIKVLFQL